jgi:hypothetical protein
MTAKNLRAKRAAAGFQDTQSADSLGFQERSSLTLSASM